MAANSSQLAPKNYLKKYQMGNAKQDYLWEELTDQAHKHLTLDRNLNMKMIMDTWTLQKGYLTIQPASSCDLLTQLLSFPI